MIFLELGTSCYERLTCGIELELLEVLDEHLSKLGSLLSPLLGVSVSVAGVKNLGIHAGEFSGNSEVEDRNLLSGSSKDRTVEDSVDDTTSVADRDTLACTVPTCVHEISVRIVSFHLLHELLSILGGVEFEERLAEAS